MRDTTPAPAHVVESLQSKLGRSHLLRLMTAITLALVTWAWVIQATDPINTTVYSEMEIAAPEFVNEMVMVTSLPRGSVTVQGPKSEVDKINRSLVSLHLDTSSVQEPGEYRLPVIVNTPDTSSRVTVEPRSVLVQIDEITSQVVPLEVDESTTENSTRTVDSISPEVSQVTVSGPSSAVNRVNKVILPVTIDVQTSSFSQYFAPYAVDANGQRVTEVTILPDQVMTRVQMQSTGKMVNVIPNVIGQPADGYAIQQRNVLPNYVIVDGPKEVLDDLFFVNTEPVDIGGASQSVSSRVGLADLPESVTVIEPSSGQVEVRVAIQDSSATTQTLSNLPVSALNVPTRYHVSIEPDTIDATITGPAATVSSMTPTDITVVVDVNGLEEGTYQLAPVVALPGNGVRSSGTNPETVEVTITRADEEGPTRTGTPIPTSIEVPSPVRRSARQARFEGR